MAALMIARAALGSDEHTCHAKDCNTEVEPAHFMCLPHWRMVPAPMREAIKSLYRPGQEVDIQPSNEYLAIARAAIGAVAHKESRQARPVAAAAPAAPVVRKPLPVTKRAKPAKTAKAAKPIQLALF